MAKESRAGLKGSTVRDGNVQGCASVTSDLCTGVSSSCDESVDGRVFVGQGYKVQRDEAGRAHGAQVKLPQNDISKHFDISRDDTHIQRRKSVDAPAVDVRPRRGIVSDNDRSPMYADGCRGAPEELRGVARWRGGGLSHPRMGLTSAPPSRMAITSTVVLLLLRKRAAIRDVIDFSRRIIVPSGDARRTLLKQLPRDAQMVIAGCYMPSVCVTRRP